MKKRLLAAFLSLVMAISLLPGTAWAAEPDETQYDAVFYVNADATVSGDGKADSPYKTLAAAVTAAPANKKTLIYVMSDITLTSIVGVWEKDITIASEPAAMEKNGGAVFTISRGDSFATSSDSARSTYNPAMIEVGGTTGQGVVARLRLENIVLDDRGIAQGGTSNNTYFIQAASDSDGNTDFGDFTEEGNNPISNTDIVQDAMIATYNGTGEITLGSGAVLKNFGGMSAVRLSGGTLIMESGSAICDDTVTDRHRGTAISGANTSYYGPAGAIWMQGGELIMEEGSKISNIVGRAIYNEGGNAELNGLIERTKVDVDMWWGSYDNQRHETVNGFIMHMRNEATATLGATAVIDNNGIEAHGTGIAVLGGCTLRVQNGAELREFDQGNVIEVGTSDSKLYFDGEITACTGSGHAINAQGGGYLYVWIGPNANIHHNVTAYGTVYVQVSTGKVHIYGKINDNISTDRGGGLAVSNNYAPSYVYIYDGAEICNNVSTQTGGGVMITSGTLTMYGGTISGNISGAGLSPDADAAVGGGVYVRRGGTFIMYDGEITNNYSVSIGGGIAYDAEVSAGRSPCVELYGGTISGNYMNATVSGDTTSGYTVDAAGSANELAVVDTRYSNINRYLTISPEMTIGEPSIYMQEYDFYLERVDDVKLGNASSGSESALGSAATTNRLGDDHRRVQHLHAEVRLLPRARGRCEAGQRQLRQ